jgi:Flp pilus assembly protein TadG
VGEEAVVRRPVRWPGRDRGAAAVEFALLLPLLLILVFGIIDFGRMLNAQITITEAAREGARASALGTDAKARVDSMTGGLGTVNTGTTACPANPAANDTTTVVVTYQFQFATPVGALAPVLGGTSFGGPITLTSTGVMPCRA